jgi:hypothetical protein
LGKWSLRDAAGQSLFLGDWHCLTFLCLGRFCLSERSLGSAQTAFLKCLFTENSSRPRGTASGHAGQQSTSDREKQLSLRWFHALDGSHSIFFEQCVIATTYLKSEIEPDLAVTGDACDGLTMVGNLMDGGITPALLPVAPGGAPPSLGSMTGHRPSSINCSLVGIGFKVVHGGQP